MADSGSEISSKIHIAVFNMANRRVEQKSIVVSRGLNMNSGQGAVCGEHSVRVSNVAVGVYKWKRSGVLPWRGRQLFQSPQDDFVFPNNSEYERQTGHTLPRCRRGWNCNPHRGWARGATGGRLQRRKQISAGASVQTQRDSSVTVVKELLAGIPVRPLQGFMPFPHSLSKQSLLLAFQLIK